MLKQICIMKLTENFPQIYKIKRETSKKHCASWRAAWNYATPASRPGPAGVGVTSFFRYK